MPGDALNVLIIGETGVGKSSVVNLIAGRDRAKVSPDCNVCTKKTTRYDMTIDSMPLHVWEIVGFNQPTDGKNAADKDISMQDVDLGTILSHDETATVDVVLFCMRGERVRGITKKILDFVKNMFWDQVPIVLVINHLELKENMEEWWGQNGGALRTENGFEGIGHVCVTGLRDHHKYKQSQEAILAQLRAHHYGARGNKTLESIFLTYLRGHLSQKQNLKETLEKRYKIDTLTARRFQEDLAPLSPTNGVPVRNGWLWLPTLLSNLFK